MRRSLTFACLALALASFPARTALHGQSSRFYTVEDIGTLGVNFVSGLAINDNGDIAGYAQLPSGDFHAFRYTDARGIEDLGGASLGVFSQAFAINSAGDVVGVFLDGNFNGHGFLAPAGSTMQDLLTEDRLIALVTSITDDGRLAGNMYRPSGETHAFRTLASGEIQDLGTDGFNSTAWRLNAAGDATGNEAPVTFPSSGRFTAFRFSDATGKIDLGTLGGRDSFGLAINSSGVIVGCADISVDVVASHAYRARPGLSLEDLGTLGGTSSCAEGINDRGEIVGWSNLANGQGHAFVRTDTDGMIDLNGAVPGGFAMRMDFARAINNRGQIVVEASSVGSIRTFRLTPIQIEDTVPPVITGSSVSPSVIWPPDGRTVTATVSVAASDNLDPAPRCRVTNVTVYEGSSAAPEIQGDAAITGDLTLSLRARRSGGDSRRYEILVSCADFSGNTASTTVVATVPHDLSGGN